MFKPMTWILLTLALTIFATVALLVGVFTPLWIFLDCDGTKVFVGLLYRTEEGCDLDSDDNCIGAPSSFAGVKYDSPSTQDKDHWSVVAGLEVGGAAVGLILTILFVVYACLFTSKRAVGWLNILLMLASIFTWLPVGCGLIVFAIYHGDAFTHGPEVSNHSFPWSALICFIAGILLVFITILIRSCCRKESYSSQALPASMDSKMALYPSSKSALINRYFAPSAFREDHLQGLHTVMDQDAQRANQVGQQPATPALYHSPLDSQQQVVQSIGSGGYRNQAFEPDSRVAYNVIDSDQRRLTTEVVLDRQASGQNVDLDNEGNDLFIYKGKDHVRKVDEAVPGASSGRQSHIGPPREENSTEQREFLYSAQHFTDRDAHRGTKYMVHTDKPSESSPLNKRLVLSPNNFSEGNVKYNPTYAYRPYSEQVY